MDVGAATVAVASVGACTTEALSGRSRSGAPQQTGARPYAVHGHDSVARRTFLMFD